VAALTRRRFRFLPLVGNEFLKPLHRASTFVMLGLVVLVGLIGILAGYLQQTLGAQASDAGGGMTDEQILIQRIRQEKDTIALEGEYLRSLEETGSYGSSGYGGEAVGQVAPTLPPDQLKMEIENLRQSLAGWQQNLLLDQYCLDHGLPADESSTALGFAAAQGWIVQLLTLFAVVLASIGVASEFSGGTIRLLLTRPFRRWKILLSKYFGVYGLTLGMLVLSVGIALFGGVLLRGFTSSPYLTVVDGAVHATPMIWIVVARFALASVDLLLISTMAFMIASVFRTSGLSIGLSLFLMFVGGTVTAVLNSMGKALDIPALSTIAKFSMFSYTDLSPFVLRREAFAAAPEVSLGFAVAVLSVYYVVFLAIAFMGFTKRDVA
jgi:ABC-2 type transport system permease protein